MPYKPTGNPPGRPRRPVAEPVQEPVVIQSDSGDEQPKTLSRAREGFRRAYANPAENLHSPPRSGPRRERHVGKRPILHPNVIAKA